MRHCTNLEEIGFDRYCCQITGEIILASEIDEHCDEYSSIFSIFAFFNNLLIN